MVTCNETDRIIVCISGGFDPIHVGHCRNIKEAKALGNYLIVILTRDEQLMAKKGYVFMSYEERKEILESLKWVDKVVENIDKDLSSKESLKLYKPSIFAKGGDSWDEGNLREMAACKENGIKVIFGVGGFNKIQSSSKLVKGKRNN